MKIIKRLIIAILLLASLAYLGFSYTMARSIVRPDVLTLEQERQWIEEKGLLGNFDRYRKEDFTVKAYQDYVLHGQFIPAEDESSDKFVIITHGFRSNRNGAIKYVDSYHKLGYNVLIYDVRGHGANAKATVSLGQFESEDLFALIQYTYETYGEDIELGLHGESMGSATSLSVLAKSPKLAFVVADCGFSNLYDLMVELYQTNRVGFLIHGVNFMTKLHGVDMKKTSPIDAVEANQVPILFIHGQADDFIKLEHSQKLVTANPSHDSLKLVDKAVHAGSRKTLGEEAYTQLIKEFLDEQVK